MKYRNPILSGFHPDPSICRVGGDFYMVNSTFEYFPGIPVYHSTDLLHWTHIGHCLTRPSQLTLAAGAPNCLGIYAPAIRFSNGLFYCVVTNVGGEHGGNFFVTAADPAGPWSEPVRLPFGGIDPSLFFDDDGSVYYVGTDEHIFLCKIDVRTGEALGAPEAVWNGTGGNNPEGPHIYKRDGFYYLLLAEGGTELCHMVTVARSRQISGPYSPCPHNPILTNRSTGLPIKAVGHADLVEDAAGGWWAVCLGIRPVSYPFRHILGRETMLSPVRWEDGWPVIGDGHIHEETEIPAPAGPAAPDTGRYIPGSDLFDGFRGPALHPSWYYIYKEGLAELTEQGLLLRGNAHGISDDAPKAILCRRQEHICFTAETVLALEETEGAEAGLAVYLNPRHHYEAALIRENGETRLVLRRRIGSLQGVEASLPCPSAGAVLRLEGSPEAYRFSASVDGGAFVPLGEGETQYLSTEAGGCFTGNMIALYAAGAPARFRSFSYAGIPDGR